MEKSKIKSSSSSNNSENDLNSPIGLYTSGYGGNYTSSSSVTQNKNKHNKAGRISNKKFNEKQDSTNINKQILPFKYLDLLSTKHINDIIIDLLSKKLDFITLLNDNTISSEYIIVILKLLTKICNSNFTEIRTMFVSSTLGVYLYKLYDMINKVEAIEILDFDNFCINLFTYLKYLMKTFMFKDISVIGDLLCSIRKRIEYLQKSKFTDRYRIIKLLEIIQADFHKLEENSSLQSKTSIYPSMEDLDRSEVNIKSHLIKESYETVNDYLNAQLNIVREDFLIPLRKTINEFKSNKFHSIPDEQYSNSLYQNVFLIEEILYRNKLCAVFDLEKSCEFSRLLHQSKKYFMFGSLIALSNNNFSTIYFATIEDAKDLIKGKIIISFCEQYDICDEFYNVPFVLMESNVYFEPYYQVLTSLSQLDETNFAMANYIVKNETTIKFPLYTSEWSVFNTWSPNISLTLNSSQREAIAVALSKELVLIQGPPGTGKTFVAIEITSNILKLFPDQKILVVCYTNQGLDNFLKGLSRIANNIVRIGNQSTEPSLDKFHINNIKHGKSNTMMSAINQLESEIVTVLKEIKTYHHLISVLNSNKGILCMDKNKFAVELKDKQWLPSSMNLLSPLSNWLLGSSKDSSVIPNYNLINKKEIIVGIKKNEACNIENDGLDMFGSLLALQKSLDSLEIESELEYDVTIENLLTSQNKLNEQIKRLSEQSANDEYLKELQDERLELEFWLKHLMIRMERSSVNFKKHFNNCKASALSFDDRWNLYWHWINLLRKDYLEKSKECCDKYKSLLKQYEELKYIQYIKYLKDISVIGMTTTSAARLQTVLRELEIHIVIFEEAAEIPESHTIASLPNSCEHLIMIGDHKQLQPHNASYELSKSSDINVSLFERLINNGLPYCILNEQHRMRPEICALISPIIYENLLNDSSVTNFPKLKGLEKNLYFITHNYPEEIKLNTNSYSNIHEAKFLTNLCRYLILNKYNTNDITILTTYSSQVQTIQSEMKKIQAIKDVKVSTVDNYQGQENRIILLSLVRSNKDANIGFLNKQNRVCVALSRAKEGLFIIGNMENLSRNSNIWGNIKQVLEAQEAIGDHLPLSIKTKSNILKFQISTYEDFETPISYLS